MDSKTTEQEATESLGDLREGLREIISSLKDRLGRFPTEDELFNIIWAENDEQRAEILKKAMES